MDLDLFKILVNRIVMCNIHHVALRNGIKLLLERRNIRTKFLS
jgi:hypothetical protein